MSLPGAAGTRGAVVGRRRRARRSASVFETPMTPRSPAGKVGGADAVVAGRGDDDDVIGPCVVDGGLEGGGVAAGREAHSDDVGAVVDGPDDAFDDVAVLAEAVGVEHGDWHDLDAGVADAGDAGAVVGRGGDDAGHGGAVTVGVAVAGRAVEDRGAGDEVRVEVGMGGVDAGVEDGDDRGAGGGDRAEDVVPADLAGAPTGRRRRGRRGHPRRRGCDRVRHS